MGKQQKYEQIKRGRLHKGVKLYCRWRRRCRPHRYLFGLWVSGQLMHPTSAGLVVGVSGGGATHPLDAPPCLFPCFRDVKG